MDVCSISTTSWILLAIVFGCLGSFIGFILFKALKRKAVNLSPSSAANVAGGCLIPVISALGIGYGVFRLLPGDPCHGAFTPDAIFVPPFAVIVVLICGLVTFWLNAWRNL